MKHSFSACRVWVYQNAGTEQDKCKLMQVMNIRFTDYRRISVSVCVSLISGKTAYLILWCPAIFGVGTCLWT